MIIGTRGSELALKQTELFIQNAKLKNYEIKIIKTKGDKTKRPLQKIGPNIFTKELDKALLNKKIDLAVHSLKDIPVEDFNKKLEIATIVERDDPRDCLIGKIKQNAIIGTDSIRRQYELSSLYPNLNLKYKSLRGNISARLQKLKNKEYDAIITANCALQRLDINVKRKVFVTNKVVPAACQGAIAVVRRKNDTIPFLKKDKLYDCCILEREFIKDLGGCKKPVGAYCSYRNNKFDLIGLIYKNNKRILVNFSGDKQTIKDKIRKWKTKYI